MPFCIVSFSDIWKSFVVLMIHLTYVHVYIIEICFLKGVVFGFQIH